MTWNANLMQHVADEALTTFSSESFKNLKPQKYGKKVKQLLNWSYDTRYNDIQHNNTQHIEIQHSKV